ncbi:hypothetical protein O3P69_017254 [Scylla paramamosain]|uniref:Chitin-binding type-2 domain-containing protein n=1 Tax=Scylla paramamosain TaxID=85552 RepID=A0AAW0TVP7_SCYPA
MGVTEEGARYTTGGDSSMPPTNDTGETTKGEDRVAAQPAVSLRGPEEDWQGIAGSVATDSAPNTDDSPHMFWCGRPCFLPRGSLLSDKSGKAAHVFYSSSSSSKSDLAGLMARSTQRMSLKHISHTLPTTYRPHTPPHPRRSNLKPSLPHSLLTSKRHYAPSHLLTIPKPPPPDPFSNTAPHPRSSIAALKPPAHPSPTLRNHYSQKPLMTHVDSRHPPPVTHSVQDGSQTEVAENLDNDPGGGNDMKTNATRGSVVKNKNGHALRLRLRQASPTLRVRLQPRQVGGEGTAEAIKATGRRVSRRLSRRKAAYPRRHILDSRRSLTPGPPYDHYRRMVHVPLRTPTTLAPLPSMLHTLPQPPILPTQPIHRKNSLLPPHTPSSSPTPAVFHHHFHHTPPLRSVHSARPPAVFSLGRSSTPRPLVHPSPPLPSEPERPPPPSPHTPPPTRSPFLTTTSSPSRISLEASREHRKPDYPTYASVPATSFTCRATPHPGIYVDVETGCQAWHVCEADGRQHSFLCPNGTIFSQLVLTCDWWYNVRCGSDGANAIHTRPSREVSEGHTDPEELYGRKIIQKSTNSYLPDLETFVTRADGEQGLLEPLVAP